MRRIKEIFLRLAAGKYAPAALALLAAAFTVYQFVNYSYSCDALARLGDNGRDLIYGIRSGTVTTSMPLLGLVAAALESRPLLLAALPRVLMALALALAYAYGYLRGGGAKAALYLLAASLAGFRYREYNAEQVFLVLAVLLFLNVSALSGSAGSRGFLARGLSLGFGILSRSTLALYPLVLAGRTLAAARRLREGLLPAVLTLAGAYALLLPWAGVNYFITGKVNFLEHERSVSNTVVGVMGAVYTAECNVRALAGLGAGDSVLRWAAARVASDPASYFLSVARRLWHLFLMFPVLFLLMAASVFLRRAGPDKEVLWLSGYLALLHCLFAIEERYFFPLVYLGALLIADAAPVREEPGPGRSRAEVLVRPVFILLAALVLWAEILLLLYPFRAAKAASVEAPPGSAAPALLRHKGELLLEANRTAEARELLEKYLEASGAEDAELKYILKTVEDTPPVYDPPGYLPAKDELRVYKMLRETELGDLAAARKDLALARLAWEKSGSLLRGVPYEADRKVYRRIVETNDNFENVVIPRALAYWSVERRGKILDALEKIMPLTQELRFLRFIYYVPADRAAAVRLLKEFYSLDPAYPGKKGPEAVKSSAVQLSKAHLAALELKAPGAGGPLAELRGVPARAALHPELVDVAFAGREVPAREFEELLLAGRPQGDGEAALRLYAARPDNPAYLGLALRHEPAGALETARDNPALLLRLSSAELAVGRKKHALALLGWVEKYARPGPAGRHAAALIYQEAGLFDEALRSINIAAAALPSDGKLLNDRGVLVLLTGDFAAAERDFRRACELAPDLPDAAINLAVLLRRKGEGREAEKIYRSLLRRGGLDEGMRAGIERELQSGADPAVLK